MRVFLAGATGVLGRSIVPLLIEQGHHVTALTRRPEAAAALQAAGADPVIADAFDPIALERVMTAVRPDVVMHQLTDLTGGSSAANADLRTRGTRNLVDAATYAGVQRMVAQSIAWAYEPGKGPANEQTPLDREATEPRKTTIAGVAGLEQAVREMPEPVILRFGTLYGKDTWYATDGQMAEKARASKLAANNDITSFVHVNDAAEASVAALIWPTTIVNVCDDDPAPGTDWLPEFCQKVGAPPPKRDESQHATWARGASNHHARKDLSWTPRYPSWREGFAALAA